MENDKEILQESVDALVESPTQQEKSNEIDFNGFQIYVSKHFETIKNLLKFNKDKDSNIAVLTNEIQNYRNGLEQKLYKNIAMNLIGLREDLKKTLRDFSERTLSIEDTKKYLEYLALDYEDLLVNLNIKIDDGKVFYNNYAIDEKIDFTVKDCEIEEFLLPSIEKTELNDFSDLVDYIKNIETFIVDVLKNNNCLDKLLKTYIDNSILYEKGIHQMLLYPLISKMSKYSSKLNDAINVSVAKLTEDNTFQIYSFCVAEFVDYIDELLTMCGVFIDDGLSEFYDAKKHRILKIVLTDNIEDNAKILNRYSDCYLLEDKVIYPQKVDIYKYQEKQ